MIDDEVRKLIENAYMRTKSLLPDNKSKRIELAELLHKNEIVLRDVPETILGTRPNQKCTTISSQISDAITKRNSILKTDKGMNTCKITTDLHTSASLMESNP